MLGITILYLHMDEENMKNRRGKKREKKKEFHSPSSMAIPRCTSSGCRECTSAHDNLIMLSSLTASEPPF